MSQLEHMRYAEQHMTMLVQNANCGRELTSISGMTETRVHEQKEMGRFTTAAESSVAIVLLFV